MKVDTTKVVDKKDAFLLLPSFETNLMTILRRIYRFYALEVDRYLFLNSSWIFNKDLWFLKEFWIKHKIRVLNRVNIITVIYVFLFLTVHCYNLYIHLLLPVSNYFSFLCCCSSNKICIIFLPSQLPQFSKNVTFLTSST